MATSSAPYIGPRPFEQTDRDVFFGRDQEANELVSLMTAHAAVLLYSQSGAGKTSLVKAGLIPLLVDEEQFNVLPPMRVRDNAVAGLKPAGVDNIYVFNALSSISEPELVASLSKMSVTDYMAKYRKESCNGDCHAPTVIVFDQFEELFTYYPERWEDRAAFFMQVRDALKQDPLLRVLFSMREDFIAELDPYVPLLPEKLRTRLRLERLRDTTALGAVTQPLEKVQTSNGRRRFAPQVAESLVHNLLQVKVKTPDGIKKVKGEFVETLQLQVVCQALWENLGDDAYLITKYDLEAYGDVDKALGLFYENAIKNTVARTGIKQGKLRQWFERALITPTGTRGTVFRGETETGDIPNGVVDELENQRIIRMELRGGAQWYELTHDRFVETVQTCNRNWLLSSPAAEQVLKRFEDKAADWDHNDRHDKYLLDDVELRLVERWMKTPEAGEIEPSREFVAFVKASKLSSDIKRRANIERRRRIQQQARTARVFRSLTLAISVLGVICLLALGVAGWLWWTTAEANKTLKENDALRQGYELLNAGNVSEAEKNFQRLLNTYERRSEYGALARTRSSLGDIALAQKDHARAMAQYKEALAITRQNRLLNPEGQIYIRMGALYFDWGKLQEKKIEYQDALTKYKDSLDSYRLAMDIFASSKNSVGADKARDGFEEAMRRYDDMRQKLRSQGVLKKLF